MSRNPKGYVEKGRAHPLQTFTADSPKDIGDTGRDAGPLKERRK